MVSRTLTNRFSLFFVSLSLNSDVVLGLGAAEKSKALCCFGD